LLLPARPLSTLFGESPSWIVVLGDAASRPAVVPAARQHGLPIEDLGEVTGPARRRDARPVS
jgi:hypothetical protein